MIAPQTTKQFDLRQVEPERLQFYAAEDTHITHLLYEYFAERLEKAGLTELFRSIEMPLMRYSSVWSAREYALTRPASHAKRASYRASWSASRRRSARSSGHPINVNSSKQVGEASSTNSRSWRRQRRPRRVATPRAKRS